MSKSHYRNVFKSDHLGSADLEDFIEQKQSLIFTIKQVKQEKGTRVAGKVGDFNIAYFVEPIKPLVLNVTNSKIIKTFTGSSFVEDWQNVLIELYIDEKVKSVTGGTTQGVRIRPVQPKAKTTKDFFSQANFEAAFKVKATKEQIESRYQLTDEVYNNYLAYGSSKE